MSSLALLRGLQISRTNYTVSRLYHVGRAASVDTAIAKGLRKSNGLGLRGKKNPAENDARGKYVERMGIPEYTPSTKPRIPKPPPRAFEQRGNVATRIRRGKKDIKPERETRPWESRKEAVSSGGGSSHFRKQGDEFESKPYKSAQADRPRQSPGKYPSLESGSKGNQTSFQSRTSDHLSSFGSERGDRSRFNATRGSSSTEGRGKFGERPSLSEPLRDSFDSKPPATFFNRRTGKFEPWSKEGSYPGPDRMPDSSKPQSRPQDNNTKGEQDLSSLIRRTNKFDPRSSDGYQKPSNRTREFSKPQRSQPNLDSATRTYPTPSSNRASRFEPRSDGNYNSNDSSSGYSGQQEGLRNESGSPFLDRNIPLSIPYTTPASEFLYGTSVVEAALSSRRIPRRKLYKLYIYTGENRENPTQDRVMEKLARDQGVEVVKVSGEWIRLLDKMSTGRPHNGYILEASPLPRLPILSLGDITMKDGLDGFEVKLDYQSREDALVNGTGTFIRKPLSKSTRNPLVLYLDSITDPGNLGGIIRTAAFLGVSAVAISTRNSAPFTPVVLKASAGASENVTIFSVNKPAGFIVDSKAAGWKVYAAVAPSGKKDPGMPAAISTDLLDDPLAEHPCILMLGSEGEGLRWNLRSKADSDLFIRGSGQSYNVDSLNVSVATGLLVNAFLSKRGKVVPKKGEVAEISEVTENDESDAYLSDVEDETSGEVESEIEPSEKLGENALF